MKGHAITVCCAVILGCAGATLIDPAATPIAALLQVVAVTAILIGRDVI